MDKVQKPINSECYTPSSEPIRINLTKVHYVFPLVLQENVGKVSEIGPRPLPSISFSIHYSVMIALLDAILRELLILSLNKP
jgi:hypothetical protein